MDYPAETVRISKFLFESDCKLNERGLVLSVNGGIDSAVCRNHRRNYTSRSPAIRRTSRSMAWITGAALEDVARRAGLTVKQAKHAIHAFERERGISPRLLTP